MQYSTALVSLPYRGGGNQERVSHTLSHCTWGFKLNKFRHKQALTYAHIKDGY